MFRNIQIKTLLKVFHVISLCVSKAGWSNYLMPLLTGIFFYEKRLLWTKFWKFYWWNSAFRSARNVQILAWSPVGLLSSANPPPPPPYLVIYLSFSFEDLWIQFYSNYYRFFSSKLKNWSEEWKKYFNWSLAGREGDYRYW